MLYEGDEQIASGQHQRGARQPDACVAWLARKVADFGITLEAGHLILPGSCTRAIDAARAECSGPSSPGSAP